MTREQIKRLALQVYGDRKRGKIRGHEIESWVEHGEMHPDQQRRIGQLEHPPCFATKQQWLLWCMHEAIRPVGSSSYCNDCRACFQQEMIRQRRCTFPTTSFVDNSNHQNEEPEIVGRRDPEARRKLRRGE